MLRTPAGPTLPRDAAQHGQVRESMDRPYCYQKMILTLAPGVGKRPLQSSSLKSRGQVMSAQASSAHPSSLPRCHTEASTHVPKARIHLLEVGVGDASVTRIMALRMTDVWMLGNESRHSPTNPDTVWKCVTGPLGSPRYLARISRCSRPTLLSLWV